MEDFDYIQRYTKEDLLRMAPVEWMGKAIAADQWIKPFDYLELFKPKSAAQLRRVLGRVPDPVGAGDSASINDNKEEKEESRDRGSRPSVESLL